MRSIALFPCSYTDGAGIIGELSATLHLRVFTDEMLFAEVSERFGVPVAKLKEVLYRTGPDQNRCRLDKSRYVNLLRCSLEARRRSCPGGRIYYGLHTSLLDPQRDRVMKVLVHDELDGRVRRAMQEEGLPAEIARNSISRQDAKVSRWTRFLFDRDAYARSLYDLVITCKNKKFLDITQEIVQRFDEFGYFLDQVHPQYAIDQTPGYPLPAVA